MKFGYKLMLSYLLIVMASIIAIGYYAYTSAVQFVKEQTIQNVSETLEQTRFNIQEKIRGVERVDNQISLDQKLQRTLNKKFDPWDSYQAVTNDIVPRLDSAMNLVSMNIAVQLFLHNTSLPEIFYKEDGENSLLQGKRFEVFHQKRIDPAEWYQSFAAGKTEYAWRQVDTDAAFGNVSLLRKMMDFNTVAPIGTMRIAVKMDDLFENLNYDTKDAGIPSYLAVVDENGRLVYGSKHRPLPEGWDEKADQYMQIQEPLDELNWRVMALVPLHELEKGAIKVKLLTLLICVVSFSVLVAISAVVAAYFSKRIQKIVFSLQAFQEGNFSKRIRNSGKDEFASISHAFNEMAENIEGLIQEVYISKLQKKEVELEALQAQIKPHFLYNTLSSISRLSRLGETDKLHRMVSGLATFYRLTLNRGRTIIPIREELKQVQAYIDIQTIKHAGRLEVSYDISFSALEYDTVKLILQPFVENALEHAMIDERLHIRICAGIEEGIIVFKVIDNGLGMSGQTIRRIFDKNARDGGYGIRNVHERIKLQFGESFGVSLHSRLGIGTTARIVIPLYKEMNGEADN